MMMIPILFLAKGLVILTVAVLIWVLAPVSWWMSAPHVGWCPMIMTVS